MEQNIGGLGTVENPLNKFEEYHAPLTKEEEQAIQYDKLAERLEKIQNDCFTNPFLTANQKVSFSQRIRPLIGHCTGKARYLRGEIDMTEVMRNKEKTIQKKNT